MPRVDNPNAIKNSLPGFVKQVKAITDDIKSGSRNALFSLVVGMGGAIFNGAVQLPGGVTGAVAATGAVSGSAVSSSTTVTAGTDVNASGNVNASGDVSASGRLIGTTGVRSSGARANILTTWIAAQIDPSGNFGIVSSSVDVKQDFEPVDMSGEVAAIFSVALIQFRYIEHVAEYGDNAPVMLGSLAQYFDSIGLSRYVTRNEAGEIDGIQYAELVKPLIAAVQNLNQRLLTQDARLTALEAGQPTQTA